MLLLACLLACGARLPLASAQEPFPDQPTPSFPAAFMVSYICHSCIEGPSAWLALRCGTIKGPALVLCASDGVQRDHTDPVTQGDYWHLVV